MQSLYHLSFTCYSVILGRGEYVLVKGGREWCRYFLRRSLAWRLDWFQNLPSEKLLLTFRSMRYVSVDYGLLSYLQKMAERVDIYLSVTLFDRIRVKKWQDLIQKHTIVKDVLGWSLKHWSLIQLGQESRWVIQSLRQFWYYCLPLHFLGWYKSWVYLSAQARPPFKSIKSIKGFIIRLNKFAVIVFII